MILEIPGVIPTVRMMLRSCKKLYPYVHFLKTVCMNRTKRFLKIFTRKVNECNNLLCS